MAKKSKHANAGGEIQLNFFTPPSNWKPVSVSDLPSLKNVKRIGLDCETKDTDLRKLGTGSLREGNYTIGWSLAIENGPKFYLPIRHEGGGNLPEEEVLRYLRENLASFEGEIVGSNLAYDIDFAHTDKISFNPNVRFRDILIADPLIYELHRSYNLASVGMRWGINSKYDELLCEAANLHGLDPKEGMWRLHSKYVGEYAERDSESPLLIYEKQREELDKQNLWKIYDLESRLTPLLVKIRRRGVRIDQNKLGQIEEWALHEEQKSIEEIKRQSGVLLGLNQVTTTSIVAPILKSLGIQTNVTATGQESVDKELLDTCDHPIAKYILHARKVNKIRTTFVASIKRYMVNGRIHCSFHQIAREDEGGDQKGVRYGRLSATDPNLQQQPSPDKDPEIAGEWRKIFLAEEGAIFGVNDFSQQEPRWTTHFAAVMDLPRAREAAKRYRDDPNTDNHDMMTRLIYTDAKVEEWLQNNKQLYKTSRGEAKTIFLGLCYGEGGASLCRKLKLPTRWMLFRNSKSVAREDKVSYYASRREAWNAKATFGDGTVREVAGEQGQEILDRFNKEVPYVREVAKAASKKADAYGYVTTVMGRRLHFEERSDGTYDWTHKALNRIIQGSSADQTKKALLDLDDAGHYIQLQVHDEIDGSFESPEMARKAGIMMEESIREVTNLTVPFKVDTECGPSWGEIK